jgi:hypothetical protein
MAAENMADILAYEIIFGAGERQNAPRTRKKRPRVCADKPLVPDW